MGSLAEFSFHHNSLKHSPPVDYPLSNLQVLTEALSLAELQSNSKSHGQTIKYSENIRALKGSWMFIVHPDKIHQRLRAATQTFSEVHTSSAGSPVTRLPCFVDHTFTPGRLSGALRKSAAVMKDRTDHKPPIWGRFSPQEAQIRESGEKLHHGGIRLERRAGSFGSSLWCEKNCSAIV